MLDNHGIKTKNLEHIFEKLKFQDIFGQFRAKNIKFRKNQMNF